MWQREAIDLAALELEGHGLAPPSVALLLEEIGAHHRVDQIEEACQDAIIIETLEALVAHVGAAVEQMKEPREQLLAFMTAHAEFFERNYWAFHCMLVSYSGMSAPTPRHDAVVLREDYEYLLRGIIADGVKRGQFRNVDPATTGRAACGRPSGRPSLSRSRG